MLSEEVVAVYSTDNLRRQGGLIGALFLALGLASEAYFLCVGNVSFKEVAVASFLLLAFYLSGWLTLLHEGAHMAYAYAHGVKPEQVEMKSGTKKFLGVLRLRTLTSLKMHSVPKQIWLRLTVFPLVIPLSMVLLAFCSPAFIMLAFIVAAGSANDITYAFAVSRAPGNFVTTTGDEIIVSLSPLLTQGEKGK